MNAAGTANSVAVRCLLEEGANASARSVYGHSALDISKRMRAERMQERQAEGRSWKELNPPHLDAELNGFNDCDELLKKAEACEAEGLGWNTCDDARARAAREQAAWEQAALERASREKKAREQAARDKDQMDDANAVLAFLQTVLAEKTLEQAALGQAIRQRQAIAIREEAVWERKNQLDQAAREQAARDDAATENAAREEMVRQRVAGENVVLAKAAKMRRLLSFGTFL